MTLLDRCAGGSILEPPQALEESAPLDVAAAEGLRQRILDGLLPYQRPICEDTENRMVAFCAGYGAGKTRTMCAWATCLAIDNPNTVGVLFAPTGPLVRDVVIRSLEDYWAELGVEYEFRASPLPEFKVLLPSGPVSILCRSMESWTRIIGLNCSFLGADELDTSKTEIGMRAVEKFLGRLRAGNRRQLGMFSTPEGYGVMWKLFEDEADKPGRKLYRAASTDNPYLPPDFIDGMRAMYPPNLLDAYIRGIFTNLTQASVYPEFSRELNRSEQNAPTERDILHIGLDLNVDRCVMAVCVQQADGIHVIQEWVARDTPGVIERLQQEYQPWIDHGQLIVCPDASSQSRSSKNAGISDFGLMKAAGLRLQTQASNPFIRDRVLTLNSLILNAKGERKLFVHPDCKLMLRGLEQHAYDQATQAPEKGDGGVDDLSGQMDALGYACWQMAGITAWQTKGHNRTRARQALRFS